MLKIEFASKSLATPTCLTTLIIVILLLGTGLCPFILIKDGTNKDIIPVALVESPSYLTRISSVSFSEPHINTDTGESIVSIPDCGYTTEPGMPKLPVKIQVYKLPFGSYGFSAELHDCLWHPLQISNPIKTVPIPVPLNKNFAGSGDKTQVAKIIPLVYPPESVRVVVGVGLDPETMTRVTFAAVHVYPVKITGYGRTEWLSSGEAVLKYLLGTTPSETRAIPTEQHSLLILSPDDFKGTYDGFAVYKESRGITTKVVTMSEINTGKYFPVTGKDEQEKVKYFIKNAIESWGINYTLIGGDADKFTFRQVYIDDGYDGTDSPCDLYFADVYKSGGAFSSWDENGNGKYGEFNGDGQDYIPDVIIGRFPASISSEAQYLVDRVINYENKTYGASWFNDAVLAGTDTFTGTPKNIPEGEYENEYLSNNYLKSFTCSKLYETTTYSRTAACVTPQINSYVNKGCGILNMADHGDINCILITSGGVQWYNDVTDALTNNEKLPVVFGDACLTGAFDQDCLGTHFVLAPNGGAITYIGCSRMGYGNEDETHIEALNGWLDVQFWKSYADGLKFPGAMLAKAKKDYVLTITINDVQHEKTVCVNNLLGDPTLMIGGYPATSVQRIDVTPENATIAVNSEIQLTAQAYDISGNPISGCVYSWSLVPGNLGIIPPTGAKVKFTAGTIAQTGSITASCSGKNFVVNITVIPGSINNITVIPSSISVEVGGTQDFTAEAYDSYGNELKGIIFAWSLNTPSIGTITTDGRFAAATTVTSGKVTASAGGKLKDADIILNPGPAIAIKITPESPCITVGASLQFMAILSDQYGNINNSAIAGVVWSASTNLGAISSKGLLAAAVQVNMGTVTAVYGNLSGSTQVVLKPDVIFNIEIIPQTITLNVSETTMLCATGLDQYNNPNNTAMFIWTASDKALGTVTGTGRVVNFTAGVEPISGTIDVTAGCASVKITVTVKSKIGGGTGSISGRVKDPTGASIQGAKVAAYNTGVLTGSGITDDTGEFIIPGLQDGIYNIIGNATGYSDGEVSGVTVSAGTVSQGNDIILARWQLPLPPEVKRMISGRVVVIKTGLAIGEATITLSHADTVLFSTISGSDGGFVFTGLAANEYSIKSSRSGYIDDSKIVSVKNCNISNLVLTMTPKSSSPTQDATLSPFSTITLVLIAVVIAVSVILCAVALLRRKQRRKINELKKNELVWPYQQQYTEYPQYSVPYGMGYPSQYPSQSNPYEQPPQYPL